MRRMQAILLLILGLLALPAVAADTVYYIHTDALGSPVAMTDANRNVVERTQYAPYGQVLNRPEHDGPGYTGHEEDSATGLTNMQQRYDDKVIGRFLSVDPVQPDGNTGASFNRYAYASDNPYKFTDPDGRQDCVSSGCKDTEVRASCTGALTSGGCGVYESPTQFKGLQAAKQFAIGVAKAGVKALSNALSMLPHGGSTGFGDSSEDGAPLTASNGTQAAGMVVGGIVANAGLAAAGDDAAVLSEAGDARALDATVRPQGVPDSWQMKDTDTPGGVKYYDPRNPGNQVRVMPGNPNSSYPNSRGPYVRQLRNGQFLDAQGNVVPKNDPNGHIPLDQYPGYQQ